MLVSHDPMAAAYADRVLALRDGRLSDYRATQQAPQPPPRPALDGGPTGGADGLAVSADAG